MYCESGGNPDAKNPYSTATGLFQFLRGTWAIASVRAGFGGYSRLDPEANIASAAWLVKYSIRTQHPGGAWGHWSCKP
ncbi:MAG: transglycosylase SLT domain-containing protein [Gammaproteobacteria bacterium]|nr:transglycosylase SLT domain-containing protein [Gammaproteobacteria bacterium]